MKPPRALQFLKLVAFPDFTPPPLASHALTHICEDSQAPSFGDLFICSLLPRSLTAASEETFLLGESRKLKAVLHSDSINKVHFYYADLPDPRFKLLCYFTLPNRMLWNAVPYG